MAQRRNMRQSPDALARNRGAHTSRSGANRSASRGTSAARRGASSRSQYDRNAVSVHDVQPLHPKKLVFIAGLVLLACVLMIFVAEPLISAEASSKTGIQRATTEVNVVGTTEKVVASNSSEASLPGVKGSYKPASKDVLAIPDQKALISLNLKNKSSATVDSSSAAFNDIRSAIADIEKTDSCGFVFFDADTGLGLAYNAGEEMYIASAAKAPFIFWLLSSNTSLDEYELQESTWTIEDSDNESFEDLYERYYADGYVDTMESYNVNHEDYYGDYYPKMGARNLAAVWTDILVYLRGQSKNAKILTNLFESTSTSFIRDGLSGVDATVLNKAGWIDEEKYRSVTDAAIIEADDRTYIMVIETSQIDGGNAEAKVSALARALFDARGVIPSA